MLTDINQLDLNKRYTYADYLTWQFDEMIELIKGRVFKRSPATSQKDFTEKYEIYQFAGVHEYWMVHPHEATVLIYRLNDSGSYQLIRQTPFLRHEIAPSGVFSEIGVDLGVVFAK